MYRATPEGITEKALSSTKWARSVVCITRELKDGKQHTGILLSNVKDLNRCDESKQ